MILLMSLFRDSMQYSHPQMHLEPSSQVSHMAQVAEQPSLQPGLVAHPFCLWATFETGPSL